MFIFLWFSAIILVQQASLKHFVLCILIFYLVPRIILVQQIILHT